MTLDELLAWAREALRSPNAARPIALTIIDKLGVSQPCGFEPPVVQGGVVKLGDNEYTFEEARWLAAALIKATE